MLKKQGLKPHGQVSIPRGNPRNRLAVKREEAGKTETILSIISSRKPGEVRVRLTFLRRRPGYQGWGPWHRIPHENTASMTSS